MLVTSLVAFTPLGVVPGVPTTLALVIIFVSMRMILQYNHIWLPRVILDRKIDRHKLDIGIKRLAPFARASDRVIRPRLTFLTHRPSSYVIALICVLLALTLPPLELLPIVDIPLWAAILAFSLALVAHDGALAIAAFILTAVGVGLIVHALV